MTNTGPASDENQGVRDRITELVRARVPSIGDALGNPSQSLGENGLGLDSVQLTEILLRIEEEFGVLFPEEWILEGDFSVERFAGQVASLVSSSSKESRPG